MTDTVSRYGQEFKEIGHCGGQFTVDVKTSRDGHRGIQLGFRHSRPTPMALFGVYALPQGIPVGTIQMGGIGDPWNPPSTPDCLPIFIASDSLGMFGHQCSRCKGYWRSGGAPSRWRMNCPYCGFRADAHAFLTEGQLKYVKACCELVDQAIQSEHDGEHVIDMDQVADAVGKDCIKPKFYYVEESQQNKFNCRECGHSNDILGRYGYCTSCGTHNGFRELEVEITTIRDRINTSQQYEACAKDSVAAFDSFARQIAKQLASRVPMTPTRRKEWERKLFHNLEPCAKDLSTIFDIDAFKQLEEDDIAFAILMFHRRHVYEHNGGEADEKYIRDSGDTTVRPKQMLHESRETALRITDVVIKIGKNIHEGFHEIFPPDEKPIQIHGHRVKRRSSK